MEKECHLKGTKSPQDRRIAQKTAPTLYRDALEDLPCLILAVDFKKALHLGNSRKQAHYSKAKGLAASHRIIFL
jgi:hypothetical protein